MQVCLNIGQKAIELKNNLMVEALLSRFFFANVFYLAQVLSKSWALLHE